MPAAVRPKESNAEIYVARESGTAIVEGVEYPFSKGKTHVRKGHPLLRACSEYFVLAEERVDYDVETATAGPGEKRGNQ